MDDYKLYSFYKKRGGDPKDGFTKFSEKGEYYFTFNVDGEVIFISENYTTATARNKGVKSVLKNKGDATRYKVVKAGKGKYYLSLKAGNNKEICISKSFTSESSAYEGASKISGKKITAEGSSSSKKSTSASKTISKLSSGKKTVKTSSKKDSISSKGSESKTKIKKTSDSSNTDSTKTSKSKSSGKSKSSDKVKKAGTKKTETIKAVSGTTAISKSTKVAESDKSKSTKSKSSKTTSGKKGKSKSESSSSSDKKKITETQKTIKSPSKPKKSESVEPSPKAKVVKSTIKEETRSNVSASDIAKGAALGAAALGAGKLFDYLSVSKYQSKSNGFKSFEENNLYYFGYNKNGKTFLRSAGSKSAKERDNAIEKVKEFAVEGKNWKKGKNLEGKYYYFLSDDKKEIAKSSIYGDKSEMTNDLLFISANFNKPIQKPIIKKDATSSARSNMNNDEREKLRLRQLREQNLETEKKETKIWPLLLLLLIPLFIFLLLFNGCGKGCGGNNKKTPVKKVVPVIKDKYEETIKKAEEIVKDNKPTKIVDYESNLDFESRTIEFEMKKCCDNRNCADGKLFYWGEPKFSKNSAVLSSASLESIKNIARLMKVNNGMAISLIGNSSYNDDEYSVDGGLSNARARAMRDVLISNGVKSSRVSYSGNGTNEIIDQSGSSSSDYKNRRIDIIINSCKSGRTIK